MADAGMMWMGWLARNVAGCPGIIEWVKWDKEMGVRCGWGMWWT